MQSFFNGIAIGAVSIYFTTLSFLGWNIGSQFDATSTPPFRNEATSTVVIKKLDNLPYLKIIAPEFKFIPVNRPVTEKTLPTPLPSTFPTATPEPPTFSSAENTVVNVYCTIRNKTSITQITGSGVVVSPNGVVLTNAHVAQFVLLADYLKDPNRKCEVRTGTIAKSSYSVHVLYISPQWVKNNADNLSDTDPKGTGEFDYGFLVMSSGNKNLPAVLPYLELNDEIESIGSKVTAIGYPASQLNAEQVSKSLERLKDTTEISKTYSFGYTKADLLIAQTDEVAQKGSSGGALISYLGKLDGIISTSIPNPQTGHTSLAAISAPYIKVDYHNSTGGHISELFSDNPQAKYKEFENSVGFSLARILLSY